MPEGLGSCLVSDRQRSISFDAGLYLSMWFYLVINLLPWSLVQVCGDSVYWRCTKEAASIRRVIGRVMKGQSMADKKMLVAMENIESKILLIRGQKVMLDTDLAELYGVELRVLNQAVKRNAERFPEDFMFQLSSEEFAALRSQNVTLKSGRGQHRSICPTPLPNTARSC